MGRKRTTLRDFLRWADDVYRNFLIQQQGMTPEEADAFMERQAEYVKNVGRSVGDWFGARKPLIKEIEPTGRRSPSEAGILDMARPLWELLRSPVVWALIGFAVPALLGIVGSSRRRKRAKSEDEWLV